MASRLLSGDAVRIMANDNLGFVATIKMIHIRVNVRT
jgi:hypothetical protein